MCNANNHHPSCTCGWGGEGHLGVRRGSLTPTLSEPENWWRSPGTYNYERFTCPNATCPVCGASVFFYKSPNGGRVYFDELGPPWPKHPCTTSNSKKPKCILLAPTTREASKFSWELDGWHPFYIKTIDRIDKDSIKIDGLLKNEPMQIYLKDSISSAKNYEITFKPALAQIKNIGRSIYRLSFITNDGRPLTVDAVKHIEKINQVEDIKNQLIKNRKIKRKDRMKIITNPDNKKTKTESFNNAIYFAFKNANNQQQN